MNNTGDNLNDLNSYINEKNKKNRLRILIVIIVLILIVIILYWLEIKFNLLSVIKNLYNHFLYILSN